MRTLVASCGTAILALSLASVAHADEWNKLTLLTFSAPVEVPGITLPAGTYRFQLADPESGRSVIKVSDKDGAKVYGMFLSMQNRRMTPSDKPVVMFKESPAGSPEAVQAWFYPGETYGYEFVYPHDQAMKIARAAHAPVLSTNSSSTAGSDADRVASMKRADVSRVDEKGTVASSDEALKDSARAQAPAPSQAQTTQPSPASRSSVGTSGASSDVNTPAATNTTSRAARRQLPRTASTLPLAALLSGLMLAGGIALRVSRKSATV